MPTADEQVEDRIRRLVADADAKVAEFMRRWEEEPMGELADDRPGGLSCSDCGIYLFVYVHGYPVLCTSCWHDWTPKERREEKA